METIVDTRALVWSVVGKNRGNSDVCDEISESVKGFGINVSPLPAAWDGAWACFCTNALGGEMGGEDLSATTPDIFDSLSFGSWCVSFSFIGDQPLRDVL